MDRSDLLDPYLSPDAAGAAVPDHVGLILPVLLSAGLLQVVLVVACSYHDDLAPRGHQGMGHVHTDRGGTANVVSDVLFVDPDVGFVVDGLQVQERPTSVRWRGDRDLAAVPVHGPAVGLDSRGG